jgi:NDP-sugar pyrophosphorylase family protein
MNIVIPMAGRGKRFQNEYDVPKPLIEIDNKIMIEWAVDTLGIDGNFIFLILREHADEYNLDKILHNKYPTSKIIYVEEITEGPACTALLSREFINNDEPLIITNCDQVMSWDADKFNEFLKQKDMDGCVVTYYSTTEKNSYVKIDDDGIATELAEKKVISEYSLNGIHYWSKGKYFVSSADEMIEDNCRVNNEFYIAPTYNYLIKHNKKIRIYNIPTYEHHAIGVPDDLRIFLRDYYEDKKN